MSGAFAPMAEKLNAKEKPVESGTRSDTEMRRMRKGGMEVLRGNLGLGEAINGERIGFDLSLKCDRMELGKRGFLL